MFLLPVVSKTPLSLHNSSYSLRSECCNNTLNSYQVQTGARVLVSYDISEKQAPFLFQPLISNILSFCVFLRQSNMVSEGSREDWFM